MATVERTLMPMGEASISFTCRMPSASIPATCSGSFAPAVFAASPGTRLSSTIVVFPDPDTPVTTVSLPFGMLTSSGFTVWSRVVLIWIHPDPNILHGSVWRSDPSTPERNGPIMEPGFATISSIVPSAITLPPSAPAFGPISISQSDSIRIRVS